MLDWGFGQKYAEDAVRDKQGAVRDKQGAAERRRATSSAKTRKFNTTAKDRVSPPSRRIPGRCLRSAAPHCEHRAPRPKRATLPADSTASTEHTRGVDADAAWGAAWGSGVGVNLFGSSSSGHRRVLALLETEGRGEA